MKVRTKRIVSIAAPLAGFALIATAVFAVSVIDRDARVPAPTPSGVISLVGDAPTATPTPTPTPTATVPPVVEPAPVAPVEPDPVVEEPAPVEPDPAPVAILCPSGSYSNSSDGFNDTSCLPDVCRTISQVPDPAHPECDVAFQP